MTITAQPNATLQANLRWFAAVHAGAVAAIALIITIAANYGLALPVTGAVVGAFAGVTAVAGRRFALRRAYNWTGADRHGLALGYVGVAIVVYCAVFGALASFDATLGPQLIDAWRADPQVLIGMALFGLVIHYALARLMLRFIANRGEKK